MHRSRNGVDCAIIRLSLTEIGHRNLKTLVAWPPRVPTRIIPDQMAFIDIQHDYRAIDDFGRMGGQLVDDRFFFTATRSGSRFGLLRCVRL